MVVLGSAWLAASWTSRNGTPARVESGGDEGVAQRVGRDALGDPGGASDTANGAGGTVAVERLAGDGDEDQALAPLAHGQVHGPRLPGRQRDADHLAALSAHEQRPVAALDPQVLDRGAERLGGTKPFRASSETKACSWGPPRPATTSIAPSSLRSRPTAWDSMSTRGRRTCAPGERAISPSSSA
jgi:hypothetical protein